MPGSEIFLSIACDTDPDVDLPFRRPPDQLDALWSGVTDGIGALRAALATSRFVADHGQPPITWLLRSDRQIAEIYGDPGFCYRRWQRLWDEECGSGSEIGWHPHLFRWSEPEERWRPYLGEDDDLALLGECLQDLRTCAPIQAVRTGWIYHSNGLMKFLSDNGILLDASATPGSLQFGEWHHDWRSTPRTPYQPSVSDYRRPASAGEPVLDILELPTVARRLSLAAHLARFAVRGGRALKNGGPIDWESAGRQGVMLTQDPGWFSDAVRQTLQEGSMGGRVFLNTYFHTTELIVPERLANFVRNLDHVCAIVEEGRSELRPLTLTHAADYAKAALKALTHL
ncbi:MAG: hypothetical protein O2968_10450 [Acidobacteria bacterium]|nr:hypothetical protein [Acidobacteriota bacterium]